jgi:ubiquinol-cytochrome c reductase cytochrome b subunit
MGAVLCALGLALHQPAPVSAGSSAKARGAELFATRGCLHCHGPEGVAIGRGPDLSDVRRRLKARAMVAQIHNGGKQMPAFGDQLSKAQIDDLVAYLRSKRNPQATTATPRP